MNIRNWFVSMGVMAATAALAPAAARADILFIDANDQAVERKELAALEKKYGEKVHIVTNDADMEAIFARAEKGEIDLTTVIGSGHSLGDSFSGTGGGAFKFKEIAAKYPAAAAQVRAFIGLGCYTGTLYSNDEWQSRYPNLTLLAGFSGSAPTGAWSAKYLKQVYDTYEKAKKKAGGTDALAKKLAGDKAARKALGRTLRALEAMKITTGTYAVCGDFHDPKPMTKEKIDHALFDGGFVYDESFAGDRAIPDPHAASPLLRYYQDLQAALGHATAAEKKDLLEKREKTVRLRYFDKLKKRWAKEHAAEITALNKALAAAGSGLTVPDEAKIAKMDRKAILTLLNDLESAQSTLPDGTDVALIEALRSELRELDVPLEWVTQ